MYAGVVTPTEASAFGSLLALILALAYRELTWPKLWLALRNTVLTSAVIMFITINAQVLNFAVVSSASGAGWPTGWCRRCLALPDVLPPAGNLCGDWHVHRWLVDHAADRAAALSNPHGAGFNGVWVGVILVVFIELGALTPPMGLNLFAISSIAPDKTLGKSHGLRHPTPC